MSTEPSVDNSEHDAAADGSHDDAWNHSMPPRAFHFSAWPPMYNDENGHRQALLGQQGQGAHVGAVPHPLRRGPIDGVHLQRSHPHTNEEEDQHGARGKPDAKVDGEGLLRENDDILHLQDWLGVLQASGKLNDASSRS